MNRLILPLPLFLLCFAQEQVACDMEGVVSLSETDAMATVAYQSKEDVVLSAVLILALKCNQEKLLQAKPPVALKIPFKRTTKRPTLEAKHYEYIHGKVFNSSEISLAEDVVIYLLSEDLYNQIMKVKELESDSVVHISYGLPQEIAKNRWAIEDRWQQEEDEYKRNTPLLKRFLPKK